MSNISKMVFAARYYLREEHQTGGMATIYKARDIETDEIVAIKRFDRDKHLPEIEAESYRREVEALQQLHHPNILRIRDQGRDDEGRPFLVLDWMPQDLVEHRERGASAFDGWDSFAEQIGLPLLDALAYAHAHSCCHRDVKPANVLIADDGTPRLGDFGISKLLRYLQPRLTLNEFASRPYAPPEPDDPAHQYSRDVFAFGALCVWALTPSPIRGYDELWAALDQVDAVSDIKELLARCVQKDPARRPETAGVLAHQLTRIQEQRRVRWEKKGRRRCQVEPTNSAADQIADVTGFDQDAANAHFLAQDINEEATIARWVENFGKQNERVVPDNFAVRGGQLLYRLAVS